MDPPNAIWVVSENHCTTPVAFRAPLPRNQVNPGNRSPFRAIVLTANSGYRTQYPLVAGTTTCCASQESSRRLHTSIAEDLGIMISQICQDCYYFTSQAKLRQMTFSSFSCERHIDLLSRQARHASHPRSH